MLNTLASQEPRVPAGSSAGLKYGRHFGAILGEYSGAAFADAYSALGAIIIQGGGHAGWWGNDVHVGDLTSLTWTRIVDPSPECLCPNNKAFLAKPRNRLNQFLADRTPKTVHTYARPQYMPPSWSASGPKGAYVKLTGGVQSMHVFAEKVDLATPSWNPITPEEEAGLHVGLALYGMAARDDSRECFYVAQGYQKSLNHHWRVSKTGVVTKVYGDIGTLGLVCSMGYCPVLDLIIGMSQSASGFSLRRPNVEGLPWKPGATGQPIMAEDPNGAHPEWDPDRNCFVFWDPLAETVYKLHPPDGEPLTQPWAWESERTIPSPTHPPVTRPQKSAGGQWSKLRRIPALRAFVYPASMTELQIIRPKGA
jgi:hypothetical protein